MSQPPSFDEDHMDAWSRWVLDNGLPALPSELRVGESVPVAVWAGDRLGAVIHVQWRNDWEGRSEFDDPDIVNEEVEVFRRTAAGWEAASGSGGGDWPHDPPLRRPEVAADHVSIGGSFSVRGPEWSCRTAEGIVGIDAAFLELESNVGIERRTIDSPLGMAVAAWDGQEPATVRVLAADGRVLAERVVGPDPPLEAIHQMMARLRDGGPVLRAAEIVSWIDPT